MRSFLLLSLFCILSLSLQAQQEMLRQVYDTKTNTWAQVTCLVGKLPSYGYAPIRIEINNGTKVEKNFTLNFTSKDNASYGTDSGSRMESSFACSCAPGSKEQYDFLVPLTTIFQTSSYAMGSSLEFNLFCSGYSSDHGEMSSETTESWPSILLSNTLSVPNSSSLTNHIRSAHSSRGNLEFAGDFNPKKMPTDWRAYLGHDVIMMTSSDWTTLDPGARTAILEWNRFGGRLMIYTTHSSDTFASLNIDSGAGDSKFIQRSMGRVALLPISADMRLDEAKTTNMIEGKTVGKSRKNPSISTGYTTNGYTTPLNHLLYDYAGSWPLQKTLENKNFYAGFFILVLLAFGILVGPVNLFVFAKAGQRHKLFITTPIISLGASAILIVIIVFQDGFGGRGHRLTLMEIQPDENNAYIIQEQAARTGVLLGSEFETSEPALMTPVALQPSRWARVTIDSNSPSSYIANHGNTGLKVSGDWFQSRSVHGHLLKTIRPSRGRVELSPRAGAPVLTSSFDFDLDTLFYQSKDQSWWTADALKKGSSVTLTPSTGDTAKKWLHTQSNRFTKHNGNHLKNLSQLPGRFFALSKDAPGIETDGSIKWLSTTTIVTGTVIP